MPDRQRLEELRRLLSDYLQQRGVSLRKPFRCLSPDHEDRHPSMSYNLRAQNVHCFACGVTYDIFDLVGIDYSLAGFPEQLQKVCELFGVTAEPVLYPVIGSRFGTEEKKSLVAGMKKEDCTVPDLATELEKIRCTSAVEPVYLLSRGITPESISRFGLFEAAGRAWFPVIEQGHVTGWCTRVIDNSKTPRYLNSVGPLGLWNMDRLLKQGNGNRLFVTEGVIDAICLEQLGYMSVALCGSQNTGKLVRYVRQFPETANSWRFVLCGDPDEAGNRMNQVLERELSELGLSVEILHLEEKAAVADTTQNAVPTGSVRDINDLYLEDRHFLERILEEDNPHTAYAGTSAAASLNTFFDELNRRSSDRAVRTGFATLDRLFGGGLYPGLYVLGAVSSIGKTSLALQIADYIAGNNRDVLYVTLEQSRHELMAKSISRTAYELSGGGEHCFSARRLLSGRVSHKGSDPASLLLQKAVQNYAAAATSLFFREGIADLGVDDIRRAIQEHMAARGQAPVVFVDYLQILRPRDLRATDKQITDRNVVELRRISRDFDIPVLAVSSFNRDNYRTAVSMEAFKESGAVEYSADVLLGLQLTGVGSKDFDLNAAKMESPRRLELVLLKNRNGIPWAKLPLLYDARFGFFREGAVRANRSLITYAG